MTAELTTSLTSFRVSNYRSLGEGLDLKFGRLTALVGPNGSGKSNVVDALRFISDAVTMGLSGAVTHRHGIQQVRRWSRGRPFNVKLEVTLKLADGLATYGFELAGDQSDEYRVKAEHAETYLGGERHAFEVHDGAWIKGPSGLKPSIQRESLALQLIGGDERFKSLVEALQRIAIYSIFPDTLRTPQKYDPQKPMERHGANWCSALKDQSEETWKPDLLAALAKLTGDIEDIRIRPAAGYLTAEFRHRSSSKKQKWFSAAQESDGTLRVAGIVSALLQEPPIPILGIEEPELTVHPGAIELLYDYLKQASQRSQVIVTTHSPELLDLLAADNVLVAFRDTTGETTVGPMRDGQERAVREGLLSLGEIHRMEGLQLEQLMLSEGSAS